MPQPLYSAVEEQLSLDSPTSACVSPTSSPLVDTVEEDQIQPDCDAARTVDIGLSLKREHPTHKPSTVSYGTPATVQKGGKATEQVHELHDDAPVSIDGRESANSVCDRLMMKSMIALPCPEVCVGLSSVD